MIPIERIKEPSPDPTKKAGPPGILIFTSIAVISNTGQRNNRPINDTSLSNIHFNIISLLLPFYKIVLSTPLSKSEQLVHELLGRLGIALLYIPHHGEGSLLEFVNGLDDLRAV